MKIPSALIIRVSLILANLGLTLFIALILITLHSNSSKSNQQELKIVDSTPKTHETDKIKGSLITIKDKVMAKKYIPSLAWIPFWDQEAAFASYKKNADLFPFISLFWYGLRPDGSIRKYLYAVEDKSIIAFAHSKRTKVLVLVANLPDEDDKGDWDYKRVDKVISSAPARKEHVGDLVALTKRLGVDGVNIDYEALRGYQKDNFTAFIKELSLALHSNGKILAVALHPKVREGDPQYSNGSEAQDWYELAKHADQLHVMTYEEHWNTSPPGPIASVAWVRSVLNYALSIIPREKLFAGVPLYGYDWGGSSKASGLTYQDVQRLRGTYKPKILWGSIAQSHYFN